MGFSPFGQGQIASKEAANSAGAVYSTEESGAITPQLAAQEAELRAKLVSQPDSADVRYALARLLRKEGKPHESLDMYTQAASQRKPTAGDLQSVALDYVLLNDYEDAIHWLELAAQMEPSNADILYSLGRCYYSKDRFVDAGRSYEQALTIAPKHLKAEENLGLVYDATNRPEMAEEAFRKAASWANENGTDEWPFLDLGSFLLDQDRPKDAVDSLRIAARIQPRCAACHEKLGRALLTTGDSAGGVAELERATELDPKNPKTHYELGRAFRQAGQADRARIEFSLSQNLYKEHSSE
jgi:Flp pilus assembly protein TadD